ncbi:fumarylacetoacetate hydrolase family protein [Sneathiella glossodoripedis]|uniref:fumarylacetoacetate hydrolase family protein n=1 Tax=Sneathiella glossodoripedis TaxID=418853 RepID=UPI00046E748F|nr:fumarylacetoacetate hydrolase family protein [Sneathiella glossodoripedis]
MKLLRVGPRGQEKPAILDQDGAVRSLEGIVSDIDGAVLGDEALSKLAAVDIASLPKIAEGTRIGPCVGSVGKFICIGLNYSDHAEETGNPIPKEPIVFMKATSAICGPNDDIEIPRGSQKTDWEVELGVVIGKRAKYVSVDDALSYVAGYCTVNDVSERAFQTERSGQWVKGKSHDTFGPIGPWLVTRDEIPDTGNLSMYLEVDGHRYQSGTTQTMIFDVPTIISHLTEFMTLEPGDIISTGTPPGVGMGVKPEPVYLKEGQTMILEVEGLGRQTQKTIAAKP